VGKVFQKKVWELSVSIMSVLLVLVVHAFARETEFEKPDLIVVLGSGHKVQEPLLNDRLEAAIKAHTLYPDVPLLLTGDEKNKSEISHMLEYIKERVNLENLLLDPDSLKTWDHFKHIKNNFSDKNVLVITNEFHHKRALMFARMLGVSAKCFDTERNYSPSLVLFIRERISRLLALQHFIKR
jgi:vancomycin permeability regulator SanA